MQDLSNYGCQRNVYDKLGIRNYLLIKLHEPKLWFGLLFLSGLRAETKVSAVIIICTI